MTAVEVVALIFIFAQLMSRQAMWLVCCRLAIVLASSYSQGLPKTCPEVCI